MAISGDEPAEASPIQAPLPPDEVERSACVRGYGILDTPPEERYDRLTLLAAEVCSTPVALLTLLEGDRQWLKSKVGLSIEETGRDVAFCSHAILSPDEVLVVPDALADDRFRENPLVIADPRIRFYAGVPLVSRDGHALGTLCVIDRVPRELTGQQIEALQALGRQAVTEMELRRYSLELARAREEIQRRAAELEVAAHGSRNRREVLERLLRGHGSLDGMLDAVATYVARELSGAVCSILLLDEWGQRLRLAAASGLPDFFGETADGLAIGPGAGSCGAAAFAGRRVVVEDIRTHPNWASARDAAARADVRSCWSEPILSSDGRVLGTCAVYRAEPSAPDAADVELVSTAASWAGAAIERARAEDAVRRSAARFAEAERVGRMGSWEIDLLRDRAAWSEEGYRLLGLVPGAEPADQDSFLRCVHPDDRGPVREALAQAIRTGSPLEHEFRVVWPDGEVRWLQSRGSAVYDPDGTAMRFVGTTVDVTERRRAEDERRRLEDKRLRSERRFRALIENSSDLVAVLDAAGRIRYSSPSTARILSIPPDRLVNESLPRLVHPEDRAHTRLLIEELVAGGDQSITGEFRLMDGGGAWRWMGVTGSNLLGEAAVEGLVFNCRDMTAQKQAEARLRHDVLHDALTGLPNRVLLVERLEHAAARARRNPSRRYAVLFLDLDGFKAVNDSLGHETGDRLLVELVPRIRRCLRASDTCARLGGDEFIVVLDDIGDERSAVDVAERIQDQVGSLDCVDGCEVRISASIGIVIADASYDRVEDILRDADVAMYRAKTAGRARHEIFDVGMRQPPDERLALEGALARALDQDRLSVVYQPIVSLPSGRLLGFEALARWHDPERGMLLPEEFVPVAEESDLIARVDRRVLREACRQLQAWREAIPAAVPLGVSVNVSRRYLESGHLPHDVRRCLARTGLRGSDLELEIAESMLAAEAPAMEAAFGEVGRLGVRVAIDDFGTGGCPLARLARLPVASLKIHRSFVGDLDAGSGSEDIVGVIVALARSMGVAVIAEGVETPLQRSRLHALGCDRAQGYLISRPMPPEGIPDVIVGHGRRLQLTT